MRTRRERSGPARAAAVVTALVALLAGCAEHRREPAPLASLAPTAAGPSAYDAGAEPAAAVLPLVPASATVLTVTDLDAVRESLGVPDLSGEDPVGDRVAFWARAEQEAPLLTDGLLRPFASELMLDHGFTQDDVDWEARWTGPDGAGFALGLRPGLDLDAVADAVEAGVGPLADAELRRAERLLVSGAATDGGPSWADDPAWRRLVEAPASATYARRGCVPVAETLGPDVDAEQLDRVRRTVPLTDLEQLPAFAVALGEGGAVVRLAGPREDLATRAGVAAAWPDPDFAAEFTRPRVDDAAGTISYDVPRPPRAAALTLLEELPFAICDDVDPLPEPTG